MQDFCHEPYFRRHLYILTTSILHHQLPRLYLPLDGDCIAKMAEHLEYDMPVRDSRGVATLRSCGVGMMHAFAIQGVHKKQCTIRTPREPKTP